MKCLFFNFAFADCRQTPCRCINTQLTIEHREDSSFDAQDGRVEVLAIAEDVELDVVVAEAEDVPLLELGGEAVLLAVAGPHLAARGHRPAVVVQPSAAN